MVTLNVTDAAGLSDSTSINITVEDITNPEARLKINGTVNEDQDIMFDGSLSSDNVGIVNYTWIVAGKVLWGKNTIFTFTEPGNYKINLTVSDKAGNTNSTVSNILVQDITDPIINVSVNEKYVSRGQTMKVEKGLEVILDAGGSFDNVDIIEYKWELLGKIYSQEKLNFTFDKEEPILVEVTVKDPSGNEKSMMFNIVVEKPIIMETTTSSSINPIYWLIAIIILLIILILILFFIRKRKKDEDSPGSEEPEGDELREETDGTSIENITSEEEGKSTLSKDEFNQKPAENDNDIPMQNEPKKEEYNLDTTRSVETDGEKMELGPDRIPPKYGKENEAIPPLEKEEMGNEDVPNTVPIKDMEGTTDGYVSLKGEKIVQPQSEEITSNSVEQDSSPEVDVFLPNQDYKDIDVDIIPPNKDSNHYSRVSIPKRENPEVSYNSLPEKSVVPPKPKDILPEPPE